MYEYGWIKLHRKLLTWEWYQDIPVKTLFLHLLLTVNFSTTERGDVLINQGEIQTTLGKLAEDTGLTVKQVRLALQKLESTGEIKKESARKYIIVRVQNYRLYQCRELCSVEEGTKRAQKSEKQGTKRAQSEQPENADAATDFSTFTSDRGHKEGTMIFEKPQKQGTNIKREEIEECYIYTTATQRARVRARYKWDDYSQEEMEQLNPFNPQHNLGLTIAESDMLYRVVAEAALERYFYKLLEYPECADAFATIIRWAKQDMTYIGGNENE